MKIRFAWLLVCIVPSCSGPPTHFYTLTPVPPATPTAVTGACASRPAGVNRVLLPEILDRQSLVRTQGTERIDISSQDRWGAPLDGIIQRILAEDLRNRLPPGRVLLPGDGPPQAGSDGIDINILHFAGDAAGHVTLQADWTLLDRDGRVALTRSEELGANATASRTENVVTAMSQALGDLADRIAAVLRACPLAKARSA